MLLHVTADKILLAFVATIADQMKLQISELLNALVNIAFSFNYWILSILLALLENFHDIFLVSSLREVEI